MSSTPHISREIDGKGRSVRELLSGRKYSIDYYQREYKRQQKQVADLLDDLAAKFLEPRGKQRTKRRGRIRLLLPGLNHHWRQGLAEVWQEIHHPSHSREYSLQPQVSGHAEFKKADLDARQALYQKLAEEIWSPDRLAQEGQS